MAGGCTEAGLARHTWPFGHRVIGWEGWGGGAQLWLALVLTAFGVGFFVWLAEWASTKRAARWAFFTSPSPASVTISLWSTVH